MKITLEKVLKIRSALAKILKQDIPVKTAFDLSKQLKPLNDTCSIFEEQKNKQITKYGGNSVPEDKMGDFFKVMSELCAHEVEIDIPTFKIQDLERWGVMLSIDEMLVLGDLITQ